VITVFRIRACVVQLEQAGRLVATAGHRHRADQARSPATKRPPRGRICLGRKKINFSQVFAGQAVGIKEVHDDIWLVSFMDYDLGYFDLETRVLEPLENPFGPKVLPMS
jgi:hypothetical protein